MRVTNANINITPQECDAQKRHRLSSLHVTMFGAVGEVATHRTVAACPAFTRWAMSPVRAFQVTISGPLASSDVITCSSL